MTEQHIEQRSTKIYNSILTSSSFRVMPHHSITLTVSLLRLNQYACPTPRCFDFSQSFSDDNC
jgi:hypothetical protein